MLPLKINYFKEGRVQNRGSVTSFQVGSFRVLWSCAGTARAEFMGNNIMYCYKHALRYADKEDVGRLDRTGEASFTTMLPNEVMLVGLGGG